MKNFQFLEVKFSIYLNRRVFVMQVFSMSNIRLFLLGVAYITDKHRGNCSFRKIETNNFDVRLVGPNEVRIRNSKEFFYFDSSAVTYEGVVS